MRDAETSSLASSLDWFNVRHMSGGQGRFQSPDPANAGAVLGNPQSWNGYAYVVNNPMSYVDPSGLYCLYPNGGTNPYGGAIAPNTYDGTIDMGGCNATGGTWYNNPTTTVTVNGDDDDSGSLDATYVGTTPGGAAVISTQHFTFGFPVSCSTVLPNGRTVGDYVQQYRQHMQGAVNDTRQAVAVAGGEDQQLPYTTGTFASIAWPNGPIDFKNIFRGQADPALLGQAGNFAYYAIGSGILPNFEMDAGAGAYALLSALSGRKPFSSLTGPMFSDASASKVRSAALAAPGCHQ